MRDLESIDDELALVSEVRLALRHDGASPSLCPIDTLLDERLTVGGAV
ncbi:hypothetical protein [Mycolicibacterium sp.]|nr:hypothetical protein [Mycolicibacterium sp.]MBJ7339263.1 hypothetical protein [Mycolicibacterium sp.]